MSPLDLENWDFLAIHRAFCCCVFSLSGFYTAARCDWDVCLQRSLMTGCFVDLTNPLITEGFENKYTDFNVEITSLNVKK